LILGLVRKGGLNDDLKQLEKAVKRSKTKERTSIAISELPINREEIRESKTPKKKRIGLSYIKRNTRKEVSPARIKTKKTVLDSD